jgi:cytochrome c peroxidase
LARVRFLASRLRGTSRFGREFRYFERGRLRSVFERPVRRSTPETIRPTKLQGVAQVNPKRMSFTRLARGRAPHLSHVALLTGLAAASVNVTVLAQGVGPPLSLDQFGVLESSSTNDFNTGETNGFFANLGTNGRTCGTCHVEADAWTFTPLHAQLLPHNDPLFAPVDGSDCPPVSSNQEPNSANSSMVLKYALIRIQLAIPTTANFTLGSATNPKGCAIAPGSQAISGDLFLFRRPLPSTNLMFLSAVMWDGRESLEKITTQAGEESTAPLLFDLADQANSATTGHAQGAPIAGTQAQQDILAFETGLSTAQVVLVPDIGIALLDVGANGGADYLKNTLTPAFAIGVNNPLAPPFTNTIFTIYSAWEPTSPEYRRLSPVQQAIGRGEAIFNNTTFTIHDVPGLNSVPSDPLYNSADPLAGQDVVAGCGLCHNNPNVGDHSTALAINIGITMAQPVDNSGNAITELDLANLPVYTLKNSATGASVEVTDPGKALISGSWTDIGKTKGPILRGLAARAPYFHNGSAKDLATVVSFYNLRFNIGLTPQQQSDLVTFLEAL